ATPRRSSRPHMSYPTVTRQFLRGNSRRRFKIALSLPRQSSGTRVPDVLPGGVMDVLFLIGRILFSLIFLSSAFAHLTQTDAMAGYAESRGVRPGRPAVLVSGLMILVGSVLVLFGIWTDLGAILIALFLLSAAFLMHRFWPEKEPMARQMEMTQFMKDIALCGGALILLFLAWELEDDLPLTITGPLFGV
ncbi:MAG: DoxX family protein, partial [Jiangellaceae bacterium]